MNFKDLNNRHAGENILVVGSGISANLIARNSNVFEGLPRVLLNHQCIKGDIVNDKTYGIFTDNQLDYDIDWWSKIKPGVQLVLPSMHMRYGKKNIYEITKSNAIIFDYDTRTIKTDRDKISADNSLYAFCGTATTAVHLAYYLGAKKIILVGIDGTTRRDRARDIEDIYPKEVKNANPDAYRTIKKSVIELLHNLGMPYLDASQDFIC